MKKRKMKLTTAGRVVIFAIILAILGGGGYFGYNLLSKNDAPTA